MQNPSVEFRIPISATNRYFRMLRYFVESLKQSGGAIAKNATFYISVSRDIPFFDIYKEIPWVNEHPITFHWMDEKLFHDLEYDGTGLDRFFQEASADVIIMADADLLFAGNFDQLIEYVYSNPSSVLGFHAHGSPFIGESFRNRPSKDWWDEILRAAGLPTDIEYVQGTGWNVLPSTEYHRFIPKGYFNYGLILMSNTTLHTISRSYESNIRLVDSIVNTWFRSQIANVITFLHNNLDIIPISINYNFPTHLPYDEIRSACPDPHGKNELSDIIIFHYLGDGIINKNHFDNKFMLKEAFSKKLPCPLHRHFSNSIRTIYDLVE